MIALAVFFFLCLCSSCFFKLQTIEKWNHQNTHFILALIVHCEVEWRNWQRTRAWQGFFCSLLFFLGTCRWLFKNGHSVQPRFANNVDLEGRIKKVINEHSNGRKLQKYRMERIRALPTQTTHRFSHYSPFWLSSDFDHSSYLLLECLQLEKGGTRWPCTDIIWQPAGHLLEIQKTIT